MVVDLEYEEKLEEERRQIEIGSIPDLILMVHYQLEKDLTG